MTLAVPGSQTAQMAGDDGGGVIVGTQYYVYGDLFKMVRNVTGATPTSVSDMLPT